MILLAKTASVAVPMRDDALLRADVYRPTTSQVVPVILVRIPYGKEAAQVKPSRSQRGAGCETPGIVRQVGIYGSSSVGARQWLAAGTIPPHLATIHNQYPNELMLA